MATRRNVPKDVGSSDAVVGGTASSNLVSPSDTSAAVSRETVIKLLLFTLAMVTLPLTSYFVVTNVLTDGNSFLAACIAALAANLVLFGYIWVAVEEDQGEQAAAQAGRGGGGPAEGKKGL